MRKLIGFAVLVLSVAFATNCFAAGALKKTVAVFDFDNDSGYRAKANLGKDFSMQLSDALIQSGKFIVLSRKDLDVVMAEQDLAKTGRFAKANAAKTGKILPAQILIKGQITEFEEKSKGGGQGLSVKGFSIGAKKSSAHVAVIVQLVDSTTGEIVDSKRVEGEAKAGGLSLGYSGDFDINTSNFKKTPLGKAVQLAIDRATVYIADRMSNMPWRGKVMLVKEDGTIFVNSGENTGMMTGSTFSVYREGEALIDPDTGMELGRDSSRIADIKITEVKEKFSKARVLGAAQMPIGKGDVVQE